MADYSVLKAQNDAAFEKGRGLLTHTDGWVVLNEEGGIKTSFMNHNGDHVARYEGSINKLPEFVVKFLAGKLVWLRESHNPNNVSTEYVAEFPDKSHVVKEVTRSQVFGDVTSYTYYSHRVGEDGVITLIGHTPDAEAYPKPNFWIDFFILSVRPTASGSDYTLVIGGGTNLEVSDELKQELAIQYKAFFAGVISDITNAQA